MTVMSSVLMILAVLVVVSCIALHRNWSFRRATLIAVLLAPLALWLLQLSDDRFHQNVELLIATAPPLEVRHGSDWEQAAEALLFSTHSRKLSAVQKRKLVSLLDAGYQ